MRLFHNPGDRTAPLFRYLRKQAGRPWVKVHSELSRAFDKRSLRGFHLHSHIPLHEIGLKVEAGERLSFEDGVLLAEVIEELTGQMHLKTGRLNDVFATAGYVHARSGSEFVVVVLQNYANAAKGPGEALQTELLRWVFEQ